MFRAARELGMGQLVLFGLYRLGLRSGYLRWATRMPALENIASSQNYHFQPILELPERERLRQMLGVEGIEELRKGAEEIVAGRFRQFGDHPVTINLHPPEPILHWSFHEQGIGVPADLDVKLVWEPARLGWVFCLGRAYYLTGDDRYAATFWEQAQDFWAANPAYMGMNWSSAQEVALRIMALAFAGQIFATSVHSTTERMERLAQSIAIHAHRIPPTLVYARAQNNNHLLSEAVGLVTAALALPDHPESDSWYRLGWRWFNHGINSQIDADGAYTQHSTNYQRLVLQLALWMRAMLQVRGLEHPTYTREKLGLASNWLAALVDPHSGHVPNLGPNDGAYILPLTDCPYDDYRPVLAAAMRAFLGERMFEAGKWYEMSLWLVQDGQVEAQSTLSEKRRNAGAPHVLEHPQRKSWVYLRAASFHSRPGHADQLHLDLWWRGINLAQDAGTYRYSALEPWNNALTRTAVHNTLTVNGLDQMTPAGRFLWLDWAQARILPIDYKRSKQQIQLVAEHDGYLKLGITHQRSVGSMNEKGWIVKDRLFFTDPNLAAKNFPITARLHWLLPDWRWQVEESENNIEMSIQSDYGNVMLTVHQPGEDGIGEFSPLVARAGELIYGTGDVDPTWGWVSPTYGKKVPALSFWVTTRSNQPMMLISTWRLP